jgi:hypothetical protein
MRQLIDIQRELDAVRNARNVLSLLTGNYSGSITEMSLNRLANRLEREEKATAAGLVVDISDLQEAAYQAKMQAEGIMDRVEHSDPATAITASRIANTLSYLYDQLDHI